MCCEARGRANSVGCGGTESQSRDKCFWQMTRCNLMETIVSLCSVQSSVRGTRLAWQLFACKGSGEFRCAPSQLSQPCDPMAKNVNPLLMHYCIMHDMVWCQGSQISSLWNKSSLQTGFVWLSSTDWQSVQIFFFFSFACKLGDFTEMPRFQLSNEKSDLALWGPDSHMATLAFPLGWACALPFASTEVGARSHCFPPSPPWLALWFSTPDSLLSCLPYRRWACGLSVDTGRGYCWTLSRSEHSLRAVICMNTAHLKSNKTKPQFFLMENFKCTPK